MKTFSDFNIEIPSGSTGHIRTTCPQCSANRKKNTEQCLSIDVERGVWYCHHCHWASGLGGDNSDWKQDDIKKHFVKPEYKAKTDLPRNVVEWFQKRGIPETILSINKIGYGQSFKDKAGIQFPYFKNGEVVNIKHRTGDKQFRQEKDAEKCLYRHDAIADCKDKTLIITEGEIDALSFQTAGYNNVCSIPDGAPSADAKSFATKFDFLKSAEDILPKFKKIILATDSDAPGVVAERELARRIGVERCWRVKYPEGCKDANDILVKHGKTGVNELLKNATPYPVDGIISPMDIEKDVLSIYDKGYVRGVLTGWQKLDKLYTVKQGEMTIVTGIPGSGKSNFVDSLVINISQMYNWKFGLFSPENWPIERHMQSLIEKLTQKPFLKNGQETRRIDREETSDAVWHLDKFFKFIVPKEDLLSVDVILEKAKVLVFRYGIRGLIIDPWNEIEHCFGQLTETQYISEQLTKIRRFARANGLHIWVVAHPKNLRKDENGNYKPPTMYEISGGANWRNKADNGICVHRPDYQNDITEVYIQKIRFREVGKIGQMELKYCRDTGTYV